MTESSMKVIYNTREDMFMDNPESITSVIYFDENDKVNIKATKKQFLKNLEQYIIMRSNNE